MTVDESTRAAATPHRRPVVLTVVVVLAYLNAVANVVVGILILLSRYDVPRADVLTVSLLGAAVILFGLLLIGVASGLARGSGLSRVFATVYLGVLIALGVLTIATTDEWDWGETVQVAVEALLVVALWTPPGSRHFTRAA